MQWTCILLSLRRGCRFPWIWLARCDETCMFLAGRRSGLTQPFVQLSKEGCKSLPRASMGLLHQSPPLSMARLCRDSCILVSQTVKRCSHARDVCALYTVGQCHNIWAIGVELGRLKFRPRLLLPRFYLAGDSVMLSFVCMRLITI